MQIVHSSVTQIMDAQLSNQADSDVLVNFEVTTFVLRSVLNIMSNCGIFERLENGNSFSSKNDLI
jgi:hypothetical protein